MPYARRKHHHEYGHYGKRHHIKAACKGVAHQICHEQEAYHKGHYEHHGAVVGKRAVAKINQKTVQSREYNSHVQYLTEYGIVVESTCDADFCPAIFS